jgi:integrase
MQNGWIERRKLPDGRERFKAVYRDADGAKRSKVLDSLPLAELWLQHKTGDVAMLAVGKVDASGPKAPSTFADLTNNYTALIYSEVRDSTQNWVESIVRKHLLPEFGTMRLGDITPDLIERWARVKLVEAGLKPASIRSVLGVMKRYMRYAYKKGFLSSDPSVDISRPRESTKRLVPLGMHDVMSIANELPNQRYRAMILSMAFGGLRFGEAAGLLVANLTDGCREVVVEGQLSRDRRLSDAKTAAGRRSIPLPAKVSEALLAHLRAYAPTHFVFTLDDGVTPLDYANFRRSQWEPALAASGVQVRMRQQITMHDLRHSAVSHWIAAGATALQVARWAGHADPAFTLKRYGHLFPAGGSDVMSRLDARL